MKIGPSTSAGTGGKNSLMTMIVMKTVQRWTMTSGMIITVKRKRNGSAKRGSN